MKVSLHLFLTLRRNLMVLLLRQTLLFTLWVFGFVHAQLPNQDSTLLFSDTIAFWPAGAAFIDNAKPARIAADGSFSLILEAPSDDQLKAVFEYDGDDCLTSSNSESRYFHLFFFDIYKDGRLFAELYQQSPLFDFRLGDAINEFHYYSAPTRVSGRCEITYDDGFTAIYVFPDLDMQAGWNILTATLIESAEMSETYTLSLETDKALRWELKAPPLENDYIGLGIGNDYTDAGFLLTEVYAQSPAARAGLLEGDIVTHVNGEAVKGMNMGAYLLRMGGAEGEAVALKILRGNEVLDFRLIRGRVVVD